jgi:hypothetical protein
MNATLGTFCRFHYPGMVTVVGASACIEMGAL